LADTRQKPLAQLTCQKAPIKNTTQQKAGWFPGKLKKGAFSFSVFFVTKSPVQVDK
jgi:hypothetical protein